MRIRRLETSDLEALCALDASCFALPWPRQQFIDELEHADALVLGAFAEERLVAALCARHVFDELWIFRIMTEPALRRTQIAHELLQRLEAFAQSFDTPRDLWLEVSAENFGAVSFYEREGFSVQQVRKEYYPIEGAQKVGADALVMKKASAPWRLDYELLDFGEGFKLERFGNNTLMRPDAAALGKPKEPMSSWRHQARFLGTSNWEVGPEFQEPWAISKGPLSFELRLSQSKNIGVFPEQEANWEWLSKRAWQSQKPLKVLNMFGYTGGATLACASGLADVCHLDSAKSTVRWASENATRSGLQSASIRWMVDDAQAFVTKELRRGRQYDGIILDPPPMGHGQGGRFEFRKDAFELLASCKKLLKKDATFFLINAYAMNLTPSQIGQMVGPIMGLPFEVGELGIKEAFGDRRLSCSVYARWRRGQ